MVQTEIKFASAPLSFPHARGDGPGMPASSRRSAKFSPRPWGWSADAGVFQFPHLVFPTPVGMVRRSPGAVHSHYRFPHARGDGPCSRSSDTFAAWFSPRPWGWSGAQNRLPKLTLVFPTPVGMVRAAKKLGVLLVGFPHARGDGPLHAARHYRRPSFSPRPWGWSAHPARRPRRVRVFPTPVGMVRSQSSRSAN